MAANGEVKVNGDAGKFEANNSSQKTYLLIVTASGVLTADAAKEPWSVEAVVASLPGGSPQAGSTSPVPFFHMLERLKTTKREGWRRFGINQ